MSNGRYDLTEFEWKTIKPLLPNKPRGVAKVDDRRVLNGIFHHLRSAVGRSAGEIRALHDGLQPLQPLAKGRHLGQADGCHHRGGKVQMIDSTSVRVHQQAAAQENRVEMLVSVAVAED